MELYYIIFILVLFSCIFEKASSILKKRIIIVWCIFFTLFGGFRWKIGGDWDQYYEHFLYSSWSNIFNYDRYGDGRETLEPGFVFINVLLKTLFGQFYMYNLIVCAFTQYTFYKFCYRFAPQCPILMYAYLMILVGNYFPVRAGLSLTVAFWSYQYIEKRNLKNFLITTAIASSIHYQCLILLPFYWLNKIRFNFFSFSILYAAFVIFGYVFQDYFIALTLLSDGDIAEKAYHYTQYETIGKTGANYASWGLNYILIMVYLYFYQKNEKSLSNPEWIKVLVNMSIAHSCIYIVFSEGMGDLTRLANLLTPAKAILFVMCYSFFIKSKYTIIRFITFVYVFGYLAYQVTKTCDWYFFEEANVPYKTIFDYQFL